MESLDFGRIGSMGSTVSRHGPQSLDPALQVCTHLAGPIPISNSMGHTSSTSHQGPTQTTPLAPYPKSMRMVTPRVVKVLVLSPLSSASLWESYSWCVDSYGTSGMLRRLNWKLLKLKLPRTILTPCTADSEIRSPLSSSKSRAWMSKCLRKGHSWSWTNARAKKKFTYKES